MASVLHFTPPNTGFLNIHVKSATGLKN